MSSSTIYSVFLLLNDTDHLRKFNKKADEGKFLGYSVTSKAYKVFNLKTKMVTESINVSVDDKAQMTSKYNNFGPKLNHANFDSFNKSKESELDLLFEDLLSVDNPSDPPTKSDPVLH